jgi:membrane associated rhomboid family serine protease
LGDSFRGHALRGLSIPGGFRYSGQSLMIPLKDLNETRTTPYVNYALILTNVLVFFYQAALPARAFKAFVWAYATYPARIPQFAEGHGTAAFALAPLFTSMFLHGGLMHLLGNMLFLYIFGDNVEDTFGHIGYLLFYLVCGVGSGLVHVLFNLHSMIPAVGASGAISGVMGAYILLFPRAKILTFFFIFVLPVPAFFILGYWFAFQFLEAVSGIGGDPSGGVAVWAHVGGFLIGMLITVIAKGGRRG